LVFPDGKRLIFYQQIDDALIKVLTSWTYVTPLCVLCFLFV
jgi:hypothetical protein